MKIRKALSLDIPTIASIGALAFAKDPIYSHFFPHRSDFPDHFYRYLLHEYKCMMATPGQLIVCAELDAPDESINGSNGEQSVVGFATFIRSGTAEEMARWNADDVFKKIERSLLYLQNIYSTFFAPDHAVSQGVITDYYRQASTIHAKTAFSGKLDFKTLAVLPAYQRQGIGEKLVEYCGFRACEEKIPVFGDASTQGLPLYIRNGCKEIGRICLQEQVVRKSDGDNAKLERLEVVVLRWDADRTSEERLAAIRT